MFLNKLKEEHWNNVKWHEDWTEWERTFLWKPEIDAYGKKIWGFCWKTENEGSVTMPQTTTKSGVKITPIWTVKQVVYASKRDMFLIKLRGIESLFVHGS